MHTDIEKDNTANKIMDHSISLEDYKLLLFQNFLAYKAAESEIEKFLPNLIVSLNWKIRRLDCQIRYFLIMILDNFLSLIDRYYGHDSTFARTLPVGGMVFWAVALLGLFLILYLAG